MTLSFIKKLISVILFGFISLGEADAQSTHHSAIKYLTDTAANFKTLVSQFKGKVVYVDIWATWCGPCKQELRQTKDIRAFADFAQKNNIIILYICADNNTKAWKQFITTNNLAGYHITAGQAMVNDFHTTFSSVQKRSGVMKRSFYIPRHIIVDRSGVIIDSTANSQGTAVVYRQINKLISKA